MPKNVRRKKMIIVWMNERCEAFTQFYTKMEMLPIRSVGPVPRLSPRMVTLVQAGPSLGEMPVTNGGWRGRDMASPVRWELWVGWNLDKETRREKHNQERRKQQQIC